MSNCKYHPLTPATFRCNHCQMTLCDTCVNEGRDGSTMRCFLCDQELVSLGASNKAEPFWRRFDKAFRYPMAASPLTLIVALSFLGAIVFYIPFGFIIGLAVTGAVIKYSFSCLQSTAEGSMTAPDMSAAYGDGLALIFRLLVILAAMTAAVAGIYSLLGAGIAGLVGVMAVVALPAVIILFAMTDSIVESINPANVFRLISSIGLPYGLLLAIIMIMSGSIGVISQLIGDEFTVVNQALNALVSNYYTIVLFHIMGYMLFQYQAELGFTAREQGDDAPSLRDDKAWALAKIQVMVKEGQYDVVAELFENALKSLPNDYDINSQYFEFLLATHAPRTPESGERLARFSSNYLRFLEKSNRHDKLNTSYKRVLKALPDYQPDTPALRFMLASACRNGGDSRSAIRLLNGLHKHFPDFEHLIPAYRLMADILDELPNMTEQAKKCRLLIQKLEQRLKAEDFAGAISSAD